MGKEPHAYATENVSLVATQLEVSVERDMQLQKMDAAIGSVVSANDSTSLNETLSASWWGWHHGIAGETCCMCSVQNGWTTLLYSAEDYHHFFGGHDAKWRCFHDCPSRCESDWHHGRYFGCYDEDHLKTMDRMYGHRSGYEIYYGHFGDLC